MTDESQRPEDGTVQLTVDDTRCIGSGQCELLAPDTFYIDDDTGIARVVGTGRLPAAEAEDVIEKCPSGALSIS